MVGTDMSLKPANRRRVLGILAGAGIAVFFLYNVFVFFDYLEDDAGISFRYAANLFDGYGLVYNPGERVEGYSNFGFVMLMGAIYEASKLVFHDPRAWMLIEAKLVNPLAALATLWLAYLFSRRLLGKDRYLSALTALLVAANGAFAINAASPLETSTYTLLLLLAVLLVENIATSAGPVSARTVVAATAALFLFSVWRIDAPFLVAAMAGVLLIRERLRLNRSLWIVILAWTLLYGIYTGFRYFYFGDLLNNPFYTKVQVAFSPPLESAYTKSYFACLGENSFMLLIVITVAMLMDYRRYLLPYGLVMAQWVFVSLVGGDWMPGFRFWAPLTPFLCFLVAGFVDAPLRLPGETIQKAVKAALLLVVAVYWFFSGQTMYSLGGGHPHGFAARIREIKSPLELNPYWRTAQWLRSHAGPKAVIVVKEAGFIPLLTNMHTIDTYGLCNRELAHAKGLRGKMGLKILWSLDDEATRLVLAHNPGFIVYGPESNWTPPQVFLKDFRLVATPEPGMFIFARAPWEDGGKKE
ncbi:MAG: hypothetical protein C0404_02190 [Verrucomicrobia bacterium]|nr:hypothetical protein [Verrucomicrobiota bacterium]